MTTPIYSPRRLLTIALLGLSPIGLTLAQAPLVTPPAALGLENIPP